MNHEITSIGTTVPGTACATVVAIMKPATAVAGVLVVAKLTKIAGPDPS